jgi:hypothetical protein
VGLSVLLLCILTTCLRKPGRSTLTPVFACFGFWLILEIYSYEPLCSHQAVALWIENGRAWDVP